jgi:hypothetical protein
MAKLGIVVGPRILLLWLFRVLDVSTHRREPQHLPRWAWLLLVLLFPLLGSVAWLLAGRARAGSANGARAFERLHRSYPSTTGRAARPRSPRPAAYLAQDPGEESGCAHVPLSRGGSGSASDSRASSSTGRAADF